MRLVWACVLAMAPFVAMLPVARAQSGVTWRVGALRFRSCGPLDDGQVRPLLEANLRGTDADAASPRVVVDVEVECAGDTALVLSLPGRGGAPRVLEVGDVPAPLRARLAALAIAELLLVASPHAGPPRILAGAPDSGETVEPPHTTVVVATEPIPIDADVPPSDRATAPSGALAVAAPSVASDGAAQLGAPSTSDATERSVRRARGALARVQIGVTRTRVALLAPIVGASLRVFLSGGAVLLGGEALLRFGPLSAGLHASTASAARDALGTLSPSLLLGVAQLALFGIDYAWLDLRGAARASAGRAAIDGQAVGPGALGRSLEAPFVEGAVVLSAAAVFGAVALGVEVALGYSAGLIALADTRDALTLSGATLGLSLDLEVLP